MGIRRYANGAIRMTGEDANNFVKALRGDDKVEAFNLKYAVGDEVVVLDDEGKEFIDTVRHPASVMGGHTAVAWLEGKGSYNINRVIRKK